MPGNRMCLGAFQILLASGCIIAELFESFGDRFEAAQVFDDQIDICVNGSGTLEERGEDLVFFLAESVYSRLRVVGWSCQVL